MPPTHQADAQFKTSGRRPDLRAIYTEYYVNMAVLKLMDIYFILKEIGSSFIQGFVVDFKVVLEGKKLRTLRILSRIA